MKRVTIAVLAMLAAAPLAARAQSDTPPTDGGPSATERLQEGAAAIVEGLRMLMDQLQGYQPPEVMPNGDIIIRRRPPAGQEPPADDKAPANGGDKPLKL
ncbi:MAG: hypothetical protein RLO51_29375 [Thalassobaculum sp.]|uniref:hypothetical protein n=1 Tax=Thalassobaculum sp. TaxID=2022740 RepID=UPI0032EF20B5